MLRQLSTELWNCQTVQLSTIVYFFLSDRNIVLCMVCEQTYFQKSKQIMIMICGRISLETTIVVQILRISLPEYRLDLSCHSFNGTVLSTQNMYSQEITVGNQEDRVDANCTPKTTFRSPKYGKTLTACFILNEHIANSPRKDLIRCRVCELKLTPALVEILG